ncbi:MAG: hypothetical protein KR126chlam4_01255 [Candidatus Anoxychlamydiales bacterium]|uniref:Uncharacterized protein n=1 Tax=marine sediment metagenome TaxID=412755 RepID=A0A0F9LA71_9ZZZZ|nr:hypothetical protein [Candidatus Anoxychlamydiales bacterium]HEU63995.1 hypothetical protein [Chlamydiota bacterium]
MNQKFFFIGYFTFWILIFLIFWLITLIKKKKQLGKSFFEPKKIKVKDKNLQCYTCGNDTFSKREALLNTTWILFFKFGFWNRSGACYVCSNCSHIHWFVESKDHEIELDETKE